MVLSAITNSRIARTLYFPVLYTLGCYPPARAGVIHTHAMEHNQRLWLPRKSRKRSTRDHSRVWRQPHDFHTSSTPFAGTIPNCKTRAMLSAITNSRIAGILYFPVLYTLCRYLAAGKVQGTPHVHIEFSLYWGSLTTILGGRLPQY